MSWCCRHRAAGQRNGNAIRMIRVKALARVKPLLKGTVKQETYGHTQSQRAEKTWPGFRFCEAANTHTTDTQTHRSQTHTPQTHKHTDHRHTDTQSHNPTNSCARYCNNKKLKPKHIQQRNRLSFSLSLYPTLKHTTHTCTNTHTYTHTHTQKERAQKSHTRQCHMGGSMMMRRCRQMWSPCAFRPISCE